MNATVTAAMATRAAVRVGIGGWTFERWRGNFYPEGLAQGANSNTRAGGSARSRSTAPTTAPQRPATFAKWRDETPDDFVFSLKASRFATNRRVLAEAGESVERFHEQRHCRTGRKNSGPSCGSSRRPNASIRPTSRLS